jgi:hypothetical protein
MMLNEYDCAGGRSRILQYSFYNEPNLGGFPTLDNTISDWTYPPPGTINEVIFNRFCRR